MALDFRAEARIDTGEAIFVKIFQDNDGNGSADIEQEVEIEDGTKTYSLSSLDSTGSQYWSEITLEPNSGGSTGFVFEEGEPVQADDGATQGYVFADGVKLTANDESSFVFINGMGIGGAALDGTTPEFEQLEILL